MEDAEAEACGFKVHPSSFSPPKEKWRPFRELAYLPTPPFESNEKIKR
jgi:hypothetical protein